MTILKMDGETRKMANENMKKVDFGKAWEELNNETSSVSVFKPKVGAVIVKILDEPVETVFEASDGSKTQQIRLKVDVAGQEQTWYVSKGKTGRSLYGQLIALGKGEGGLAGKQIQLLVKASKNKAGEDTKDYTVVEAIKYLQQGKEEKVV
jgi:hypothetical protein